MRTLLLLPVSLLLFSGCRRPADSAGDSVADSGDSVTDSTDTTDTGVLPGEDYTETFGIDMLALLGPDTFTMGTDDPTVEGNERPAHLVTLTHSFWLGRTEVTQYQFRTALGVNPSYYPDCDDCPVDQVTWFEAAHFANVMSTIAGIPQCYEDPSGTREYALTDPNPYACSGYRLPTEAEWEYAARGLADDLYSGSDDPDEVAWTTDNSDGAVHAVCTLQPNALGFCDLSGNIWELVGDGYGLYTGEETDPRGLDSSETRVNRSGSWHDSPEAARVTNRSFDDAASSASNLGFRLGRSVP